jgi:Skp family chaperone for outer membrane proteins
MSIGLAWVLLPAAGARAGDLSIVVVDMDRVMKSYGETKTADALLREQVEEFRAEIKKMREEEAQMARTFEEAAAEARNKALSDEERSRKGDIARERLSKLNEFQSKIRETVRAREEELSDQKGRMRRRIVDKLRGIVRDYASKKGFTVVLDSSALGVTGVETVVYNPDSMDITREVLKLVETEKPSASKADEAKEPAR